jgi:hypothetical protein
MEERIAQIGTGVLKSLKMRSVGMPQPMGREIPPGRLAQVTGDTR